MALGRALGLLAALLAGPLTTGCATAAAAGDDPPPAQEARRPRVWAPQKQQVLAGATKVRVLVGGDLLPHRPMLDPPERLRAALAPLKDLLASADAAVANYETATGAPESVGSQRMALAASPEWLGAAAERFHALTLANNHACDLGRRGLVNTIAAARASGVVGLGADDADPWRARVLAEKDGRKVCAVAWTTFVNTEARACPQSGKIALAAADAAGARAIERAVAGARAEGCGATVAIFHGGHEYETQTWPALAEARLAADAGADAVVIHHPHVPSPVVVYTTRDGRAVPVFASVGNLVSNQGESYRPEFPATSPDGLISRNAWTRLGVLAELEWVWPSGAGKGERPALTYGYHLTWTDNEHATHREEPMPRIATHVLAPDDPLVARLGQDAAGPTELFGDPCWLERGVTRCAARPAARPLHRPPDVVARRRPGRRVL